MSYLPARILLATDGSTDAALAAKAAVDLSAKMGVELHVVHVWQPAHFYPDQAIMPRSAASFYATLEEQARGLLEEQVRRIEAGAGSVAQAHLRSGNPAGEIISLGEELNVGLVALGSRGLGPIRRLVLGSVSEAVVHHARFPVLVLRGGDEAWPPSRIVVGDDGSEDARRAAELAAGIGKVLGASMDIVHAYPPPAYLLSEKAQSSYSQVVADALRETGRVMQERADGLERILGQAPHVKVRAGEPAATILEVASEDGGPALIAVASRGIGAVQRMMLGSVSSKVLHAATGPVLVYPHVG
ncbi:MAG: universal stress protein [Chloroflexota bacterium]|nr:universal stress protein [Chloroflexota bacterium]